jgi:hypothetical protein
MGKPRLIHDVAFASAAAMSGHFDVPREECLKEIFNFLYCGIKSCIEAYVEKVEAENKRLYRNASDASEN